MPTPTSAPTTLTLTRPDGARTLRLACSGVPLRIDAIWYRGARPEHGPASVSPADVLELLRAGWRPSAAPEPFLAAVRDGAADDPFPVEDTPFSRAALAYAARKGPAQRAAAAEVHAAARAASREHPEIVGNCVALPDGTAWLLTRHAPEGRAVCWLAVPFTPGGGVDLDGAVGCNRTLASRDSVLEQLARRADGRAA